jgi:hypothetical protein
MRTIEVEVVFALSHKEGKTMVYTQHEERKW